MFIWAFFGTNIIVITPEKFFEKKGYVRDRRLPMDIIDALASAGFYEAQEAVFETDSAQNFKKLEKLPELQYSPDLQRFLERRSNVEVE